MSPDDGGGSSNDPNAGPRRNPDADAEVEKTEAEVKKEVGGGPAIVPEPAPLDRRSEHAKERAAQGRRTGPAFNDAQRAGKNDVFLQPDGRYVVRGPNGREHIFEPNGQLLTSVNRSNSAHIGNVRDGNRRIASEAELQKFREIFR